MNVKDVIIELKLIDKLTNLDLGTPNESNVSGIIPTNAISFKDANKNELMLSNKHFLFVAHMYKDTSKEFFYLMLYRVGKKREYRKHNFNVIEHNKIFVTGKNVKSLIDGLKLNLINYEIN